METSAQFTGEFASAMQQLSAEAAKSLPQKPGRDDLRAGALESQIAQMLQEFRTLNSRVQQLETTLTTRLEEISRALPETKPFDFVRQFQKLDEHIAAIRSAEGMNQRLFDSLHDELIKYRDDFLRESLQKPFIRDLIILFDDLSALLSQLKNASKGEGKRGALGQWRDNLENAIHSLIEILHRLEVNEIEAKERVDLGLHRVVSYEPTEFAEDDGRILMRVKRGFFWREGVLRPEEVIATRFN